MLQKPKSSEELNPMEQYSQDLQNRVDELKKEYGFEHGNQGDIDGLTQKLLGLTWKKTRFLSSNLPHQGEYEYNTENVMEAEAISQILRSAESDLLQKSHIRVNPKKPVDPLEPRYPSRFVIDDLNEIQALEKLGLKDNMPQKDTARNSGGFSRG